MNLDFDNYIFDLYGTLVDIHTDEENLQLWEKMASYLEDNFETQYTAKELKADYARICKEEEDKLKELNHALFPEIKIEKVWLRLINKEENVLSDEDDDKIKKLCIFFRETSRDKFQVYDGVFELFAELRKQGKKIFLLSNAQRSFTEKELKDTGLYDKFDDIFISSDKGIKKPQKEFLEKLMEENELSPQKSVMVGNDIYSDVGVAFKNSIHSIFLNTYNYSEKRIDKELREIGIKGSVFMPLIIQGIDNLLQFSCQPDYMSGHKCAILGRGDNS